MGTRGFIGIVIDGDEKIAYNHFDSYPSGVGVPILNEIRNRKITPDSARALRAVQDGVDHPRDFIAEKPQLLEVWDPKVRSGFDWYSILRNNQGSLTNMVDLGLYESAGEFPFDSLFAEWGYLVDLDAGTFEVYKGFQAEPPTEGRWATPERLAEEKKNYDELAVRGDFTPDRYFAVQRVACWPLDALPTEAQFLALENTDAEVG